MLLALPVQTGATHRLVRVENGYYPSVGEVSESPGNLGGVGAIFEEATIASLPIPPIPDCPPLPELPTGSEPCNGIGLRGFLWQLPWLLHLL